MSAFTIVHKRKLDEKDADEIKALLQKCDHEFIPSLSNRVSTTDKKLKLINTTGAGVDLYFESIIKQSFVLIYVEKKIVAFLSYISNYSEPSFDGPICNYVSTVITLPEYRGLGLAEELYICLFAHSSLPVLTRTWGLNDSHIHILSKLGFENYFKISNDRGKGIDTIYFLRSDVAEGA